MSSLIGSKGIQIKFPQIQNLSYFLKSKNILNLLMNLMKYIAMIKVKLVNFWNRKISSWVEALDVIMIWKYLEERLYKRL